MVNKESLFPAENNVLNVLRKYVPEIELLKRNLFFVL